MKRDNYPFEKIHSFCYSFEKSRDIFRNIVNSPIDKLYEFGIKDVRFDTIREGSNIFLKVVEHLKAKQIVSSGVGVREGVSK